MSEKKYIDTSPFIRDLTAMKHEYTAISLDGIIKALKEALAADVVSRSAYDQIRWERDVAMQQLDEAGIPFGGKSDKEYAPVVRCKDCKNAYINSFSAQSGIAVCRFLANRSNGELAIVQQDDFCSYGERKEESNG